MDSITALSDLWREKDTMQDLTDTPPSYTSAKADDTKQDPADTIPSCTDSKLVELAGKLHLKPYVQSLFFESALLFLRKEYNIAAVAQNSDVQPSAASFDREILIEKATSSFLQEMGLHIWPSYVKNRQHLTVVSPYGDNRPPMKERMAATITYKVERDEWERGLRAQKPVKPANGRGLKGLLYLGKGRMEIEKSVRAYMERMVKLVVVDEA